MSNTAIRMRSGRMFDYVDLDNNEYDIREIARSLAREGRFTNQCEPKYSVAQHSAYVAQLVPREYRLQALLHDAHEYVLHDWASPLKNVIPQIKSLEASIQLRIDTKFGVEHTGDSDFWVHYADRVMVASEFRDLFVDADISEYPPPRVAPVVPCSEHMAYKMFMEMFEEYYKGDLTGTRSAGYTSAL